jgi:UDP-GlcNAc:undecaprenyl-phosphate GlcNAc-1-phosphate transferase
MWETLTNHLEVLYGAALALVIVVLLTPAVGGMARMLGVVDRPGMRRLNRSPVPRLGGLALFFGIFVPALAFLPLGRETKGLLLGAAVATLVGAIDDFRGLVWWEKLGGQIAAAAIPTGFGIWVQNFTFPLVGVHQLPGWVGVPLTILWIVAIMNMVNFLDGLDGLAAGVCGISGFTFCLIALSLGRPEPAILAAIVFGACLGFLRHNFYPARIFMGDSGALLLGLLMAVATISGVGQNLEGPSGGDLAAIAIPIVVPLLVLAVPLLDVVLAIVRRMRKGIGIAHADKEHIHHRLMDIGHSHRQAVLLMYLWGALIAGAALVAAYVNGRILVVVILVSAVLVATVLPRLIRDRTPRGSDRRPVAVHADRRAGRHRRRPASEGRSREGARVPTASKPAPADADGVPLRSESTPPVSDTPATSRTRDTA